MKNLVSILLFFSFWFTPLLGQTELVFHARPTQMGYCESTGDGCTNELTPLAGQDLTSYLLKIWYQQEARIRIELFKNGKLLEQIYSDIFTEVKLTRKFFQISGSFSQPTLVFHSLNSMGQHSLQIDISKKIKKGKISFHYPEEQRIYLYMFDLL